MSDIPEIILRQAFDLVESMKSNKSDALTTSDTRYANLLTDDTNAIARALMAERKRALEEAAKALDEMAKMTALAAKHADNAVGRSAGQFGAEVLQEAAAAIRKLGEG